MNGFVKSEQIYQIAFFWKLNKQIEIKNWELFFMFLSNFKIGFKTIYWLKFDSNVYEFNLML